MRCVVIGSGNVAEALAIAIASEETHTLELVQIFGRNELRLSEIAELIGIPNYETNPAKLAAAELYIIAVSDGAIAKLATELTFTKGAIVAHTAGSVEMEALPKSDEYHRAVLYPLQSFSKGFRVDFREIPIFIEAEDGATLSAIKEVAIHLSDKVIELSSEKRRKLHLGAIFVNNFVNAMLIATTDIATKNDLELQLYEPLLRATITKAMAAKKSPIEVQTGPAIRGDQSTMDRHIEMLERSEELIIIYKTISKYIWETSKRI